MRLGAIAFSPKGRNGVPEPLGLLKAKSELTPIKLTRTLRKPYVWGEYLSLVIKCQVPRPFLVGGLVAQILQLRNEPIHNESPYPRKMRKSRETQSRPSEPRSAPDACRCSFLWCRPRFGPQQSGHAIHAYPFSNEAHVRTATWRESFRPTR